MSRKELIENNLILLHSDDKEVADLIISSLFSDIDLTINFIENKKNDIECLVFDTESKVIIYHIIFSKMNPFDIMYNIISWFSVKFDKSLNFINLMEFFKHFKNQSDDQFDIVTNNEILLNYEFKIINDKLFVNEKE